MASLLCCWLSVPCVSNIDVSVIRTSCSAAMLTSDSSATATNISTRDTPATRMDGTPCDLTSDAIGLGAHLALVANQTSKPTPNIILMNATI